MAEVSKRCSLCELWGLNCTLHCFYSLSTSTSLFPFHLSLFSSFLQGSFTLRPLLRDADSLLLLKISAFPHRWNERQVKANGNRQLRSLLRHDSSAWQGHRRSSRVTWAYRPQRGGSGAFPRQSHLGERETLMKAAIFPQNCFGWHLGCDVIYKIEALGECRCRLEHWLRKAANITQSLCEDRVIVTMCERKRAAVRTQA